MDIERFEMTVEDAIQIIKKEGVYLTLGKEGYINIYPAPNTPRDEILELINNNHDQIADYLSVHSYLDS